LTFVRVFTQLPLQHVKLAAHGFMQPPQCALLVAVFTQLPAQQVWPAAQR
jgi:hypothetical protein